MTPDSDPNGLRPEPQGDLLAQLTLLNRYDDIVAELIVNRIAIAAVLNQFATLAKDSPALSKLLADLNDQGHAALDATVAAWAPAGDDEQSRTKREAMLARAGGRWDGLVAAITAKPVSGK